jgi:two-component system, chemotaxis family, sensor histidine kinase and response regulator WspE
VSGLGAFSMWDLFRGEVESQMRVFIDGLLAIEAGAAPQEHLAATMRAAHSIKGAARIVQLDLAVGLSHAMEDCLVAAQEEALVLDGTGIDVLLAAGDLLSRLSAVDEAAVPAWVEQEQAAIDVLLARIADVRAGRAAAPVPDPDTTAPAGQPPAGQASTAAPAAGAPATPAATAPVAPDAPGPAAAAPRADVQDRTLKIAAQTLNRLMGLAGESLVQSRWFEPFSGALLALKKRHSELGDLMDALVSLLPDASGEVLDAIARARLKVEEARQAVGDRHGELEAFALRSSSLSDRLYREVVAARMRPFGDGVEAFPRLVRDIARQLGKQAQFEVVGRTTEVDREVLERLEAPLNHIIRNSLDHGIEPPEARVAAGKPPAATIRIEARHRAGLFVLTVTDDGCGVDIERLRATVIRRGLVTEDMAANFTDAELLEFLFLPGFSTAKAVTDLSGRGVGLDAVQDMVKSVGGVVRLTSRPGHGITIQMELPLTLSVVRTFVAEIGGEPFAFPVTRIARAVLVAAADLASLEGQQYVTLDGERIGVVPAHEVLGLPRRAAWTTEVPVVLLGDRATRYGMAVDRFVGEYDMVVRPLDARLGKVKDVSATALLEDGSPVLILDVEDLTRSVEMELKGGRLRGLGRAEATIARRKRVLVIDDSITVREVERSLLKNRGYEVEVAVDGMDGWNALRTGQYDLTLTDLDMPRMTGIELVTRMKADPRLHAMPVIIVSYKDRDEDRLRGLEAGADRYMTKSSFHDETLLAAVAELIGGPE